MLMVVLLLTPASCFECFRIISAHARVHAKSIPDYQEIRAQWHKIESPIGLWKEICHGTLKMVQIRDKFELWKFDFL